MPVNDELGKRLKLSDNDISSIEGIGKLKHLHYVELFLNKINKKVLDT